MTNYKQKKIMKLDKNFMQEFVSSLLQHGSVKITSLGVFKIKQHPARVGLHPATGKEITIEPHTRLKVTISSVLKRKIQL